MLRFAQILSLLLMLALFNHAAQAKSYRLYVVGEPKDARVVIWNIKPKFQQGMYLPPGTYDIQVSKDGYHSKRQKIDLGKRDKRVIFKLKRIAPKTQRLYVNVKPAGATIKVMTVKPKFKQGMALPVGEHKVVVSHPGYQTLQEIINIGKEDVRLYMTLPRAPVQTPFRSANYSAKSANNAIFQAATMTNPPQPTVYITTEPPYANIFIANLNRQYTPGMVLPLGQYELQVSAPGYQSQRQWINVGYNDGNHHIALSRQPSCYAGRYSISGSRYDELDHWIKLNFTGNQVTGNYSRVRVSDSLQVENMHFNGWQRDNIIVVEGSTERNGQIFKEQRNFFLQDKKLRLDIGNMWIALQPISCPTQ